MNFPEQVSSIRKTQNAAAAPLGVFDMRDRLSPRRLTLAMWDQAYVMRHVPGGSFADFDRVLDEAVERGYNTLRIDPMPQWIDLSNPDQCQHWDPLGGEFLPWDWNTVVDAPVGRWIIEFMEKLLARPSLHYTLSTWWQNSPDVKGPPFLGPLDDHHKAAELWARQLRDWQRLFGFDRLVYVDISNEFPYFLYQTNKRIKEASGQDWDDGQPFNDKLKSFVAKELNGSMAGLREEFPELRFTASIHGDERWLDIPVEFDCLDVHFYASADVRWNERTKFIKFMPEMFQHGRWHAEFSDRCLKTHRALAPMLRARQRGKLASFSDWARRRGMPLTTSESWASWFYIDSPDLDWGWLLDWAEWSVEDAIEFGMWGWTPHNYCQPTFANWRDVQWHQKLTGKFVKS